MKIVFILIALIFSACAPHFPASHLGPIPSTAHGERMQGALIDIRAQRFISFDALVTAVAHAHVIAIGEEHYHPDVQAFELRFLRALAQRRPQHLALGMEFLERDAQQTVDAYLAGTIDQTTFQKRLKASASFMRLYFPLVRYAQQAGLPIIAMNAPRRISRQVAKHGLQHTLESLGATERAYLPASLAAISEPYRTYFLEAVAEAHPLKDEQTERYVEASHLKDTTMATSLAEFLERHPNFTVLAIAGRFHFDYGIAIPSLLYQRRRRVIMRRVTTIAVTSNSTLDLHHLAEEAVADYLHFVPPAPEEHNIPGFSPSTANKERLIPRLSCRLRHTGMLSSCEGKMINPEA